MSNENQENSRKTLILGSSGFLGSYFTRYPNTLGLPRSNWSGIPVSELSSSTSFEMLENLVVKAKPEVIINCIALTSINQCEREPVLANFVNSDLPSFVAKITASMKISFVHFSTDAVFDGQKSPYSEMDSPSPISHYGKTKLQGENNVIRNNPEALVLRTNFFGFSFQRPSLFNFFHQNLKLSRNCDGYSDVIFSPLYVKDVCNATFALLEKSQNGLFHVVGSESLTKFEFGRRIASSMKISEKMVTEAKRPSNGDNDVRSHDLRLDNTKMKMIFQPKYSLTDGIIDSLYEASEE